ncbi:hypothetical protein ACAX46_003800 [Providencia rettgeri]
MSALTALFIRCITSTLTREISTHAKLAKQRGDSEYEKYLNGRLRRLNEIEKECLGVARFLTIFPYTSRLKYSRRQNSNKGVNNDLWFIPANLQRC